MYDVAIIGAELRLGFPVTSIELKNGERVFAKKRPKVTTTVRCGDGRVLPVKTDAPIPKEKMLELIKIVNNTVAHLPIFIGDVIIEDVIGCNIVATKNM